MQNRIILCAVFNQIHVLQRFKICSWFKERKELSNEKQKSFGYDNNTIQVDTRLQTSVMASIISRSYEKNIWAVQRWNDYFMILENGQHVVFYFKNDW